MKYVCEHCGKIHEEFVFAENCEAGHKEAEKFESEKAEAQAEISKAVTEYIKKYKEIPMPVIEDDLESLLEPAHFNSLIDKAVDIIVKMFE